MSVSPRLGRGSYQIMQYVSYRRRTTLGFITKRVPPWAGILYGYSATEIEYDLVSNMRHPARQCSPANFVTVNVTLLDQWLGDTADRPW
jgi:hypothetical protein